MRFVHDDAQRAARAESQRDIARPDCTHAEIRQSAVARAEHDDGIDRKTELVRNARFERTRLGRRAGRR